MSLPSGAAAASSARRGDSCFCGIIAGTSEDPRESPHVLGKRDRVRAAGTCPGTKTAVLTEAWSPGGWTQRQGGLGRHAAVPVSETNHGPGGRKAQRTNPRAGVPAKLLTGRASGPGPSEKPGLRGDERADWRVGAGDRGQRE